MLIGKIIRKIIVINSLCYSNIYKNYLKIIYPDIIINKNVFIENGVKIILEDGGKLEVHNTALLRGTYIHIGKNSNSKIEASLIGRNCVITSRKKIEISKGVQIAEMTVIRDQDHNTQNIKTFTSSPIIIEKNVWIANKVTITKGVTIGKNSVIGANSVVTNDIPENIVAAGNPAKKIKSIN
jgi:acetyltransferase-like isoleucine patch superfamily enzyme